MAYTVEGMTLIPQKLKNSCWYASAQMLIKWREKKGQETLTHLIPPELDAECLQMSDNNNKLQNPQIIQMAERIGLKHVPPISPSAKWIEIWLKTYGPLWVNGKTHIVVIAGIKDTPDQGDMLLVYDPSPIGVGLSSWRGLSDWYPGSYSSSRDAGNDVKAVFLYVPDNLTLLTSHLSSS